MILLHVTPTRNLDIHTQLAVDSGTDMRLYQVLLITIIPNTFAFPKRPDSRDFGGLLDGDTEPFLPHSTYSVSKPIHDPKSTHDLGALGGLLAGITATSSATTLPSVPTTTGTSEHQTTTFAQSLPTLGTTATSSTPSTATQTPTAGQSSSQSRTWKIIGVSVIAVTFVAGSIFIVAFFDQWSRFLRDMVLGKKKGPDFEDLVPDWEKRTWEVRLAEEEGHRYPSISALSSNPPVRQPSTCRREDNPRHPFPTRPSPDMAQAGVGLGFSAAICQQ